MASSEKDATSDEPFHFWRRMIAGGLSGAAAKTCSAPLDRVKILYQVRSKHYPSRRGVLRTLASVVQLEKPGALFKGNMAQLLRIVPYSSITFVTFERVKMVLGDSPAARFASGSVAGVTATLVTYPLDLVRARLAASVHVSGQALPLAGRIRSTALDVLRRDGLRGFYNGGVPTLFGIVPYAGTSFLVFGMIKQRFGPDSHSMLPSFVPPNVIYGGFAGAVAQTVTYPIDVVRRRMQLHGMAAASEFLDAKADTRRYPSAWRIFTKILRKEGIFAFYRGLSLNYYRVIPSVGVSFATHEFLKDKLGIGA